MIDIFQFTSNSVYTKIVFIMLSFGNGCKVALHICFYEI